jgi:1,4-alpha-glucan branching enzyme
MKIPKVVVDDPWLNPFKEVIRSRINKFESTRQRLIGGCFPGLKEFANGHLYYGCYSNGIITTIREWLPNAIRVVLIGEHSQWQESADFDFKKLENGNWEVNIPASKLGHGQLYRIKVYWNGGNGERIPAWAQRVIQDTQTHIFNAQVWSPGKTHTWKHTKNLPAVAPIIYEAHIGMAGEAEKVSTFDEFRKNVLPRVIRLGYNTIQLMAIQEHPYYGSFGYHVSGFFSVSSRFGTPEQLKELIDECHLHGIRVIMDIVHSHAVKNVVEGLGLYDGTRYQFFHDGARGEHPAWDSYCFNYGKNEVLHFLLSNIKFWLDEFRFDGFRFDGVTSMIYFNHGLGKDFTSYEQYFDGGQDEEALVYLMLANQLMKELNESSISIAEEMSGYPGLASSLENGGIGFDYRLAMGIPDFWIKTLKEKNDENWDLGKIYHELTSKRSDEKVISYAESHDQALVGDKTIAFRLMDKEMYFNMLVTSQNLQVDRGMALHKMIRLLTLATAGGGYLNFMGNEFGHPEWIDFPREGNNWSYKYATRQWSLVDREDLKFRFLNEFDISMINLVREKNLLNIFPFFAQLINQTDLVLAFSRSDLLFVFNFNPTKSFTDYGIPVMGGKYRYLMGTDELRFGGFGRIDETVVYPTFLMGADGKSTQVKLYLPARSAIVLQRQPIPSVYQKLKTSVQKKPKKK